MGEYFGFGFETETKAFVAKSKAGFDPKLSWKSPNPETSHNFFKIYILSQIKLYQLNILLSIWMFYMKSSFKNFDSRIMKIYIVLQVEMRQR